MKYTKAQLSEMARQYFAARDGGDPRAMFVTMKLAVAFGMTREQVDRAINGFIIKEERQAA